MTSSHNPHAGQDLCAAMTLLHPRHTPPPKCDNARAASDGGGIVIAIRHNFDCPQMPAAVSNLKSVRNIAPCRSWVVCVDSIMPAACPVYPRKRQKSGHSKIDAECRLCCKSRKLQGDEFFAKIRNGKQSPIRITSIALPKSPVSLT